MAISQKLPVLLVDDNKRFRQGIQTFLGHHSKIGKLPIEVVAEAATTEQAVSMAHQKQPALILLDLELASGNGISTLIRLKEMSFVGKVLVLSAHQEDDAIFQAMQAGAKGYVFKNHVATQLCDAIATVLNSEVYLPTEVASSFFRKFWADADVVVQTRQKLNLSNREQEVLHWLVKGESNEEIAKRLFITVATVKAHLTNIFEKLQVTSRTQAVIAAFKFGLIQA
ncbi:response regulator transcription factor [Nostoc sp. FACHB-152]|uniref:LuxR C-terminal-related transcriptional regulator n=1 Tax=unclassified Nostoc TaxID=2593658 RepID=UPI001683B4FB|nr:MULTISPECIES: response regulator transcription factor [unclassified Nostoc]MBD2449725.1 response regulator transcription factor [Nostoc sp. FACHB-152]MBD2469898.1 response regulator transcription factor [Nostoc sp. FACHB-145]